MSFADDTTKIPKIIQYEMLIIQMNEEMIQMNEEIIQINEKLISSLKKLQKEDSDEVSVSPVEDVQLEQSKKK